ncbi:MAG: MerR family transcriptional regulator [Parvibaculales bacterium]
MSKSDQAFKTISEVSQLMDLEPHVLRFWETKFKQIQPIKRARGRRLYRPEDVVLISNIKHLLHDEGMTIKGVQKVLREKGVAALRQGEVALTTADTLTIETVGNDHAQGLRKVQEKLLKLKELLASSRP